MLTMFSNPISDYLERRRENKRSERRLEVNRVLTKLDRQIKKLEKDKEAFLQDAREAYRSNLPNIEVAKTAIKNTVAMQRLLKQARLNFSVATRREKQVETYKDFAQGMQQLSTSISELAESAEIKQAQKSLVHASSKANKADQKMKGFVDQASQFLSQEIGYGNLDSKEMDQAIDQMIKGEKGGESESPQVQVEEEPDQLELDLEQNLDALDSLTEGNQEDNEQQ